MKKLAFIKRTNDSHWVGDGFPVRTIFSYNDIASELSPFLLLDYAGPATFPPTSNKLGVPQHPHRGFETVTIVYEGGVSHRDSRGGGGTIGPGDVQWMTAASGLVHEEYHSPEFAAKGGAFEMIQLWVNLPSRDKMAAPRYQAITADRIPEVALPDGAGTLRVIAGQYGEATGAAGTFTPMNVWDLRLKAGRRMSFEMTSGHTAALFVLHGAIRPGDNHTIRAAELAVMEPEGTRLEFYVDQDARLLLLSGEPFNEPIVGYGPFVMNSQEQIDRAIDDYNSGHFGQIVH
ncbi:MAG: pirin family protein [Chlorobiaceae bacterium]|nr:pirin family protein [Chlorobiaceae bacterium]